jgi:hypothetical protein
MTPNGSRRRILGYFTKDFLNKMAGCVRSREWRTSAATETCFFVIYLDLLKNPYTFWDKSHTILRVRAKTKMRMSARWNIRMRVHGNLDTVNKSSINKYFL